MPQLSSEETMQLNDIFNDRTDNLVIVNASQDTVAGLLLSCRIWQTTPYNSTVTC